MSIIYIQNKKAFTLIEFLMSMLLMSIIAVVSINVFTSDLEEERFNSTKLEMEQIKTAILGGREVGALNKKLNFGYQGDMGGIPASLNDLITQGVKPAYSLSESLKISSGWNGPYLQATSSQDNFLKDAWGTNYIYDTSLSPAILKSLGADGLVGGTGYNTDLIITIANQEYLATVIGLITVDGSAYNSTATVEINSPNGVGVIATQTASISAGELGKFSFSNVPFGESSITVYLPDKTTMVSKIGPVPIVIDRAFVTIPAPIFSFAEPCTHTNDIVISATPSLSINKITNNNDTINFNYTVSSSVIISHIRGKWVNSRTLSELRLNNASQNYLSSGGTNDLFPSNASSNTKVLLNPSYTHSVVANVQARLRFSNSLITAAPSQSKRKFLLTFYHSKGCSLIDITMP